MVSAFLTGKKNRYRKSSDWSCIKSQRHALC